MQNPFLNEKREARKDMKTVTDYNRKRQLEIFNGQCFNNASAIFAVFAQNNHELHHNNIAEVVFDLAKALYIEGMKRNYIEVKLVNSTNLEVN